MKTVAISVIIPTYQRCSSVRRLLEALTRQTLPPEDFEVIVSIDGSDDGTTELVSRFAAPYHLQSLWQRNRGRAAACNAGILVASGELLVLLDDDMEPMPGWLEAHQRAHARDARLGVVGAAPITVEARASPTTAYIGDKFNQHLARLAQPNYAFALRDFYSGNFSVAREVMTAVGGFDEAFTIYGNEDLELSLRLQQAGVRLIYSTAAVARQHYTKSFAALARDNIAKGRTAVILVGKHPETFQDLKLSTFRQGSRLWCVIRGILLVLSRWRPGIPEAMVRLATGLERWYPAGIPRSHTLTLDYCYWLGVRSALREYGGRHSSKSRPTAGERRPRS